MAQLVVRRAAHKIRMINVKQRRWHNESVANKTHDTHEMNRANCDFRIDLTFIYVSMTQKPSKILRRVQKKNNSSTLVICFSDYVVFTEFFDFINNT